MTPLQDDKTPKFGSPEKVEAVCAEMQKVEDARAGDRSMINRIMNGGRPYTPAEKQKHQIRINVNWGEGPRIISDANRQVNNALIPAGNYFSAYCQEGPVEKRDEFGQKFTRIFNDLLKRGKSGKEHFFLLRNRNGSVCLHGIGPLFWSSPWILYPKYVAIEDLLIPTETYLDLSNLTHFAINMYLTAGEFFDMTQGSTADKGWNQNACRKILADVKKLDFNRDERQWLERPENMQEIWKQNRGLLDSDVVPRVKLRSFFHQDPETGKWYRKVILKESTPSQPQMKEFIYESSEPFADDITKILHIQYADTNICPPYKYHSTRGLGPALYAIVETVNRMRCEFVQHVFEQLKMYFKINDPIDRDRIKKIELFQYGVIEQGMSIVPNTERHQVDPGVVQMGLAQMRQLMSENSASYVQSSDEGTQKERTKFEVQAKLNLANQMIGGMLQTMYANELFYYEELLRRVCMSNPTDPYIKRFQQEYDKANLPKELLRPEAWEIIPERVLGGGDITLGQAQSQWLLENQQRFEPSAQRMILKIATSQMLNDPEKAEVLVPEQQDNRTTGTEAADKLFGTLMQGVDIGLVEGIDHIGYIASLLMKAGAVAQRISQTDNMGTPQDIQGLQAVAMDIQKHLAILASNPEAKPIVKHFADMLSQLMNEVKAFAQRQQEAQQKAMQQQQGDPGALAKAQTQIYLAQVKGRITEQKAAQQLSNKQRAFEAEEMRKNAQTTADLFRTSASHAAKLTTFSSNKNGDN